VGALTNLGSVSDSVKNAGDDNLVIAKTPRDEVIFQYNPLDPLLKINV